MAYVEVSLPAPVKEWLEERVRRGPYETVSDYVVALIEQDQKKRDTLVDALIEGEKSGIGSQVHDTS
jgi:antitoxin ParD1/3/4